MTPLEEKLKEITDPAFFMDRSQEELIAAIKQAFREIIPEERTVKMRVVRSGETKERPDTKWNACRSEILKQLE